MTSRILIAKILLIVVVVAILTLVSGTMYAVLESRQERFTKPVLVAYLAGVSVGAFAMNIVACLRGSVLSPPFRNGDRCRELESREKNNEQIKNSAGMD